MRLEGKTALVTGGGTGAGQAIAAQLAAEGAQVVIMGRREEKLRETCQAIQAKRPVRYFVGDVASRDDVSRIVDWVSQAFGQIDILVNNAAVNIVQRRLHQLTPENWDYLLHVNSTGAFNMVHAVLPAMRERRDGLIINISSISGMRPSVLAGAAYSASKAALGALSKLINLEEAQHGIRSTLIYPGEINTPILDARPVPVSAEQKAAMLQPEDVAAAVVFVACLPARANVPDLVIKPTNAEWV